MKRRNPIKDQLKKNDRIPLFLTEEEDESFYNRMAAVSTPVFNINLLNKRIKELTMSKTKVQLEKENKQLKERLRVEILSKMKYAKDNSDIAAKLEVQTREYTDAAIKWENEVGELKEKINVGLKYNEKTLGQILSITDKNEMLLDAVLKLIEKL